MFVTIKILVISYAVVCLLLPTQGCLCPSCQQKDGAERCMCCVYRQLGKRSGSDPRRIPLASRPTLRDFPTSVGLRTFPAPSILREYPIPATSSAGVILGNDWLQTFLESQLLLQAEEQGQDKTLSPIF
ncbi:hypothetical protein RRG08_045731 [Elysia crispata]|uniref:Uncharacterized protein n=1 Tax=Elysia crispata TaxID=231223 RepID=A0AAE1B0L2_9GAST|nr:hypothetical protein RRG08_045731 [Elysia crispata]